MSEKNERITIKDVLVLGVIYLGLLSLLIVLPENSPIISGCILAAYAFVSYVAIPHHK